MIMLLVALALCLCSAAVAVRANNESWAYVDVRPGAHMFYWLYEAATPEQQPLVMWLQGGPGSIDRAGPEHSRLRLLRARILIRLKHIILISCSCPLA